MNNNSGKRGNDKVSFTDYELSNGLKIILSRDTTIPSAAINICCHVGSKDEDPDKRGYAHLFEHLMFEGSKNILPGQYDKLALKAGCENNAYTTEDKTNYFLLTPSNQLEFGLWLESDRMLGFSTTEHALETQKEVVIEEKKQNFDNRPYGSVNLEFPPRLFKKSGYSWDTIGDVDDLKRASIKDIRTFYEKFYVPNNSVLSVVGDIDINRTSELIEKYFGTIPAGLNGHRKSFNEEPLTEEVDAVIHDSVHLPGIFIAYRVPQENSKEFYELDVLSDVLSTGESSRLYHELVYKKQLVSEIGCWLDAREFAGVLFIYAILMPGKNTEQVKNEIDRIINEVKSGCLTDSELQKVKNRIETRHAYRLQTNLAMADLLAHYKTFYNNAELINTNIENYSRITRNDITETAAKFLNNTNRVSLTYLPEY
jgi:predicted Zn-dependent peptidase